MLSWILAASAVVGLVFICRAYVRQQTERHRRATARAEARRVTEAFEQPDMDFAAQGFAGIAVIRKNDLPGDLVHLAKANAWHAKKTGASELQVLSALWGGIYAIDDDLVHFKAGLEAYEAAKEALGREPANGPYTKLYASAGAYLAIVLRQFPNEFERFTATHRQIAAEL